MVGVVNSNPGYDGLKKKAVFVPHEDKIYHGFEWSQTDKEVMAANVAWHKHKMTMPESDVREYCHYAMSLPPTLAMWLDEQPEYKFGTDKEKKKFIDKMVANEPIWKMCQRF